MSELAVTFPEIIRPTEFTFEDSDVIATSPALAEVASESDIAKESEGWGYTNPDLHRRIVDKEFRHTDRAPSSNYYTISSTVVDISQGRTLILPIPLGLLLTVTSCTYDGQELVQNIDYSLQYSHQSVSITLLAGSTIVPAQQEKNKTFIINFTKVYRNDYALAVQGVNSYRTTTRYMYDPDESNDINRPETP